MNIGKDALHRCAIFCWQECRGTGLKRIKPFRATATSLLDSESKPLIMKPMDFWR
ncbi:unnamed protein product [Ectocarpus sp. CCAP 1310/34]|nr:unnamed protein product [Ectocarpus sp. CCAP 1310/34]